MNITYGDLDIQISDWTPRLKLAAVLFSVVAVLSVGSTWFFQYTVPGLTPIAFGVAILLLGVREWNVYFKAQKDTLHLALGITCTLLFAFCLCMGIYQILDVVTKQVGL